MPLFAQFGPYLIPVLVVVLAFAAAAIVVSAMWHAERVRAAFRTVPFGLDKKWRRMATAVRRPGKFSFWANAPWTLTETLVVLGSSPIFVFYILALLVVPHRSDVVDFVFGLSLIVAAISRLLTPAVASVVLSYKLRIV